MINWKVRLRNPRFWVALLSAVALLAQQIGLNVFPENWKEVLNTVLTVLAIVGIVEDPTTAGLSDSERAMNYEEPK
ncbi:phage holin [Streptococcus respiraculi]|uniref:phage holin n=1 Tax=Streptococcus respiraculi TaxID=2021971 RepID=UPI000E72F808|nr:phage holin [Streptococcus respiraculi]